MPRRRAASASPSERDGDAAAAAKLVAGLEALNKELVGADARRTTASTRPTGTARWS